MTGIIVIQLIKIGSCFYSIKAIFSYLTHSLFPWMLFPVLFSAELDYRGRVTVKFPFLFSPCTLAPTPFKLS